MFTPTSRYAEIETATYVDGEGRELRYVRRRFLPPAASLSLLAEHTLTEGERLDHIAAQGLGDPEQFWRLCDANVCLHPDELTAELGRRLRIPLLQGG
jgi:hypothetical protein